jgi:hypothetical protein
MAVPTRPVAGAPIESAWGDVAHDTAVAQDLQVGSVVMAFAASSLSGVVAVVFPRPFSSPPIVVVTGAGGPHYTACITGAITTTGFSIQGRRGDGTNQTLNVTVEWLAYGPRA